MFFLSSYVGWGRSFALIGFPWSALVPVIFWFFFLTLYFELQFLALDDSDNIQDDYLVITIVDHLCMQLFFVMTV